MSKQFFLPYRYMFLTLSLGRCEIHFFKPSKCTALLLFCSRLYSHSLRESGVLFCALDRSCSALGEEAEDAGDVE